MGHQSTAMASSLSEHLDTALSALGLPLPAGARSALIAYLGLLDKWNRTYNLTAIRDPMVMLYHHLIDSLAILPTLETTVVATRRQVRLLDVGSGAGLPAIPLAIARPDWAVSSVEASGKKAAFQRQAQIELGLRNLTVLSQRVEALPADDYDIVSSRAFASLADFVSVAGNQTVNGTLCAMKGQCPDEELRALPPPWQVAAVVPIAVPGLDAARHLILMKRH